MALAPSSVGGTLKPQYSNGIPARPDEPCSALDPIATAVIEELIVGLRQDYSIGIVTHSMQQASRVSQRTAYFHLGGRLTRGRPKSKYLADMVHMPAAQREAWHGRDACPSGARPLHGQRASQEPPSHGCEEQNRQGADVPLTFR